jgi:hypothetical protein
MKSWKPPIIFAAIAITAAIVYWAIFANDFLRPSVLRKKCDVYAHLDVAQIPQGVINWCWAASAQMIMDYERNITDHENSPHRQCDQANKAFGQTDCCDPDRKNDWNTCNITGWPRFKDYRFHAHNTKDQRPNQEFGNIEWGELVAQICARHPIAFSFYYEGWDDKDMGPGSGHMMVANGYVFVPYPEDLEQQKHVEFINPCVNQMDPTNEPSWCVADTGFMSFDLQFVENRTSSSNPVTNPIDCPDPLIPCRSDDSYKHWRDYYNIYFDPWDWLKNKMPFPISPRSSQ